MYNGKKILALIPARSGSKGLKDKNIKELNGKPMIAYTIEAALRSGVFDEVFVSTDSEEYAKVSNEYGATASFLRTKELSSNTASSTDVIIDTLTRLHEQGRKFDYFVLLQPTSPLRDEEDIRNAVEFLFTKNAKSVVSVCELDHSPLLSNTLPDDLSLNNFFAGRNIGRRQDMLPYYRLNGAIYISEIKNFLIKKSFYTEQSYGFVMKKLKSIDVDDIIDFNLVKLLMSMDVY